MVHLQKVITGLEEDKLKFLFVHISYLLKPSTKLKATLQRSTSTGFVMHSIGLYPVFKGPPIMQLSRQRWRSLDSDIIPN